MKSAILEVLRDVTYCDRYSLINKASAAQIEREILGVLDRLCSYSRAVMIFRGG